MLSQNLHRGIGVSIERASKPSLVRLTAISPRSSLSAPRQARRAAVRDYPAPESTARPGTRTSFRPKRSASGPAKKAPAASPNKAAPPSNSDG